MIVKLKIYRDETLIDTVEVTSGFTFGRSSDCSMQLDDAMISRTHATVKQYGGELVLEDNGSVNGILDNGVVSQSVRLTSGRTIEIPPFRFEVVSSNSMDLPKTNDNISSLVEHPKSLAELLYEGEGEVQQDDNTNHPLEATEIEENSSASSFNETSLVTPNLDSDHLSFELANNTANAPAFDAPATQNPSASTMLVAHDSPARLYFMNVAANDRFRALDGLQMTIGRATDCYIQIAHPSISQHHASIRRDGDVFLIEDLKSTNGTRINGETVRDGLLRCHDVVELGEVQLEFLEGAAQPQARSCNVVEIADSFDMEGITKQPKIQTLDRFIRPLTLLSGLIAFGLLILPVVKPVVAKRSLEPKNIYLNEPSTTPAQVQDRERDRIVKHQLTQARTLIQREKYEEAKVKVDLILEQLDQNNIEARTMRTEIERVSLINRERQHRREKKEKENINRKQRLMRLAGEAFDDGQLGEAKSMYRQVLAIDSNNSAAKEQLKEIELQLLKNKQKIEERNKRASQIKENFTQGMVAYNANNYTEAATYLRQVVEFPNNPNFSQARIALDDIEEKLLVEIEDRLTEAKDQFASGNLVQSLNLIKDILVGNPTHQEALTLKSQVEKDAREQAQKIYREGYTFERLVQDMSLARERYQKVIELLPDPSEAYHQKARSRLNAID